MKLQKPRHSKKKTHTCANEHHIVSIMEALHVVHSNLCVVHRVCEEHRLTFDRTVHQEVVFHKV